MFWTWLWGTLGLLLSTPLTVCLAVLGKYVPSLRFFATLLGEDAELEPDVRLYQRLVALDRDGSIEVVEGALKQRPHVAVFDQVLVPALARAERDAARGELGESEQEFVWGVVGELLDGLEGVADFGLTAPASSTDAGPGSGGDGASPARAVTLVGLAVQDTADALILRMLGQLLVPSGCTLVIVTDTESPMLVAGRVAEQSPGLVVSHLPPDGLTSARYLVRRLRAQFAELPIVVGRWGEDGGGASAADRLIGLGASHVVSTLAEARDRILGLTASDRHPGAVASAPPAWGVGVQDGGIPEGGLVLGA